MNPEIKAKWVNALRSGEYKQGTGYLRNHYDEYCCLGVLCDLAVKSGLNIETSTSSDGIHEYDGCSGMLPDSVMNWADTRYMSVKYRYRVGHNATRTVRIVKLSELNDGLGDMRRHSFAEIANIIEEQL